MSPVVRRMGLVGRLGDKVGGGGGEERREERGPCRWSDRLGEERIGGDVRVVGRGGGGGGRSASRGPLGEEVKVEDLDRFDPGALVVSAVLCLDVVANGERTEQAEQLSCP